MTRTTIGIFFAVATLATGLERAHAQAIQLKDGSVVVGEVTDATSDGLSFRRLDNGGLLELGWDDLSLNCATQVKRLKGLVIEDEDEVTLEADVVTYALPGAALEEVVGLIVDGTATELRLKRKSGILPIRRQTIKKLGKAEVPVLEVYTKAEFYERTVAETDPGEDADRHIQIAEIMRRVGLYEQAIVHLERAVELGTSKQKTQLPQMLHRVRTLAESAEERDLLSQIRVMRNRQNFKRATELIAEFEQRFPDSELSADLDREKERFGRAREQYMIDRMRQLWDRAVRQVAGEHVSQRDSTYNAARDYAEDQMSKDVFDRVGKVVGIEADEAESLWKDRQKYRRGLAVIHSYGIGSWVLGEDKIIAGTKQDGQNQPGAGESEQADREMERLVRKLREIRERGRRAAQKRRGSEEETEESWWKSANRQERTAWLRAYFAEFGGQMEVVRAYAYPCGNCAGLGFLEQMGDSGKIEKRKCPVCHGTQFTRTLRAR